MPLRDGSEWATKPGIGAQLDRAHPLAQAILQYCLINEQGGTATGQSGLFDLTGRGNAFTAGVAPTWSSGQYGPGVKFTGSQNLYTQAGVIASGPFTVSMLATAGTTATASWAWSQGNTSGSQIGIGLSSTATARWENNGSAVSGATTLTLNSLYRFTLTYDNARSTKVIAYVTKYPGGNVIQDLTAATTAVYTNSRTAMASNTNTTAAAFYTGTVFDLIIWNRALSPADVQWLSDDPWVMVQAPSQRRWYTASGAVIVPRGVIYIPAQDTIPDWSASGYSQTYGGKPSKSVTPQSLRIPTICLAEDTLSYQIPPARADIYGGKPSRSVTPPSLRQPLIVPAEDNLSYQTPPARGDVYGGKANRAVTPPSLRPIILGSTEDVYTNQIPATQVILLGGDPNSPVTPRSLRNLIQVSTEDTYSYTIPATTFILGGDPNRPVTPPSLRPVLFSQEPVTVGAETGTGSVVTNRTAPPVVIAGQGPRLVQVNRAEDPLPEFPITLLRPVLVSPGKRPTWVQFVGAEAPIEVMREGSSFILPTKVKVGQITPTLLTPKYREEAQPDTGTLWLSPTTKAPARGSPRPVLVSLPPQPLDSYESLVSIFPKDGGYSLKFGVIAPLKASQPLPGVTFVPQEPLSPYTGSVIFVNAPLPKNSTGVTKQAPVPISDEYAPLITIVGSAGGGVNISTQPPVLVQIAIQPRVQPRGASSRESDITGKAGG